MDPLSNVVLGLIFAAGRDARTVGDPRAANPVETAGAASSAWFAGWDEADVCVAESERCEFYGVDFDNGVITIRGGIDPE